MDGSRCTQIITSLKEAATSYLNPENYASEALKFFVGVN